MAEVRSLIPRCGYQSAEEMPADPAGSFTPSVCADGPGHTWNLHGVARSTCAQIQRQADYAWQVLALILAWGVDRSLILANPCARGGRLYRANRVDKIWTPDDQAAFLRSAPPHLHLPSAQQSRSHSSPLHGGWVLGQLKISHGITSSSREVGVSVRSSHREILATKHGDAPVTQRRRAHRRQRRGMSSRNGH